MESFDITVHLTEDEAARAISAYIAKKLGNEFSVDHLDISFEFTQEYEDRPCGGSTTVFNRVSAKAKKHQVSS